MAFLAPAIPFILGAATVVSAYSAVRQGRAAKKEAQARAELERTQTAFEAKQSERMKYLRLGAARAATAKSGGFFGEGSALDVLSDIAAQSDLERQQILQGGGMRASAWEARGKNEARAGYLQAGADLLSGSVGTYDAFMRTR